MNTVRVAFLFLSILAVAGCREGAREPGGTAPRSSSESVKKAWHCPMHPQIVQASPGSCPICGMDLVPLEAAADGHDHGDSSAAGKDVKVDPGVLRRIGVRTEIVEAGTVGREIRAEAEGVLDQASEASVTVRAMGYLESVASLREGDPVEAGQTLASFYSPDIAAAQEDWLGALRAGDSLAAKSARERLLALGFPEGSFARIAREDKAVRAVPILSPVRGWVLSRSAVRGQAAMAGTELFRLVEGRGAILEARVPMSDAASLRRGDQVEVRGDGIRPGAKAKVVSLSPRLDRATRTVAVRLAPVAGIEPRPGALYSIRAVGGAETGFVVPADAVLRTGSREIVFLALGDGRFRPVEVRTGSTSGGKTLVESGIEAGDEVVVAAQFLLDGESRLQAALDQLTAGADAASPHAGHGGAR